MPRNVRCVYRPRVLCLSLWQVVEFSISQESTCAKTPPVYRTPSLDNHLLPDPIFISIKEPKRQGHCSDQSLARGRITQIAPELLGTKGTCAILLPVIIVCREEDDASRIGGECLFDGTDCSLLVGGGGDGNSIRVSGGWPAGLRDDNFLILVGQSRSERLDLGG